MPLKLARIHDVYLSPTGQRRRPEFYGGQILAFLHDPPG